MDHCPAVKQQQQQTLYALSIETLTNTDDELLGMNFSYQIHDKRMTVMVLYDAPPQYDQRDTSVPAQYLDRYDKAGYWSDDAKNSDNALKRVDTLAEEIEGVIHKVCYDLLIELAGPPSPALMPGREIGFDGEVINERENVKPTCPPQTLHEYMYPDSIFIQLVSQGGKLKGIRRDGLPPPTRWPTHSDIDVLKDTVKPSVPIYTPSQIHVLKPFLFHPWVLLVSIRDEPGRVLCCKLSAAYGSSFEREYGILHRMHNAGDTIDTLHVPQLRGLIRADVGHGEDGGIIGILMDHIDTERYELTYHLAPALPSGQDINYRRDSLDDDDFQDYYNQPIPEIDPSRRTKWSCQIKSIVHQLHALDIVWGDAKTANILLDKNDDLWVIDFGGGAPGWIDRELVGTKEGDLQALERILEEISGKRRVWRSDVRPPSDPAA